MAVNKFLFMIFICFACKLSGAEIDFIEITRLVKGLNFSAFVRESTPQDPTESEFEKWLKKRTVKTVTPAAILTITRAACGFNPKETNKKTGMISVHSMMFLDQFLRALPATDATLLSAVSWNSQMLRVIQCGDYQHLETLLVKADIAPIKAFSKNMHDVLLNQAVVQLQNSYTETPQGLGRVLRERSPYYYASVWIHHLLNKPVKEVQLLIGFAQHLEDQKIHLDEQCRPVQSTDVISHDEAAARVYRSTIGQNTSAYHELALLIEDKRIVTDLGGRRIDFSQNSNTHFELAGDLYAKSWKTHKIGASLTNLALLISRSLYNKDENGRRFDEGQRHQVEARLYRRTLDTQGLEPKDRGIALNNLGLCIENERTFEDADGQPIAPKKRMDIATAYYRTAIHLEFSEACNNLALAIEHGDTNLNELGSSIDPSNRMSVLADLYKRSQSDVGKINLARLYVNHPELLTGPNREKFKEVSRLIDDSKSIVVHTIIGLAYSKFLNDKTTAIECFREGVRLGDPRAFTYLMTHLHPGVEIIFANPKTFAEESDDEEQDDDDELDLTEKAVSAEPVSIKLVKPLEVESADDIMRREQAEKKVAEEKNKKAAEKKEENAKRLALKREDKILRAAEALTVTESAERLMEAARRGEMAAIRENEIAKKKVTLSPKAQKEFDSLTPAEQQKFMWLVESIKLNTKRVAKPETLVHCKLKSDATPLCTRRFTLEDRLVYAVHSDGGITIYGIRGHDETIKGLQRTGMLQ